MRRMLYDGFFKDPEEDRYIVVIIIREKLCKMLGYYSANSETEVQCVPFNEDGLNVKYYTGDN